MALNRKIHTATIDIIFDTRFELNYFYDDWKKVGCPCPFHKLNRVDIEILSGASFLFTFLYYYTYQIKRNDNNVDYMSKLLSFNVYYIKLRLIVDYMYMSKILHHRLFLKVQTFLLLLLLRVLKASCINVNNYWIKRIGGNIKNRM